MVEWLFLAVPWCCLWLLIVVFPDHTHLPFCMECDGDRQAESPSGSYVGVVGWEGRG